MRRTSALGFRRWCAVDGAFSKGISGFTQDSTGDAMPLCKDAPFCEMLDLFR
jgi:hypothetical protein